MRFFMIFQRKNQIFDHEKYESIPETLYDNGSLESCWITIPETEAIITDPNLNTFMVRLDRPGTQHSLLFFGEKDYFKFREQGGYIREVFPLADYPWYLIEDKLHPDTPRYTAGKIHVGPVMTIQEFEDTIDWRVNDGG